VKKNLKNILAGFLGWQVRRLRKRHNFKIVGVVGSIGKTSTKLAIAKVLESEKRVRFQEGNYNDIVSVPLVFFGQAMPPIWNIFLWIWIFIKNEVQIYFSFPFDVVVVELGTDGPGQINQFRKYLHLDMAVLTAITPEHMEYFKTIENVAEEEWSVVFFSDLIFANKDLCKVLPQNLDNKKIIFYGKDFGAYYKIENVIKNDFDFQFSISGNGKKVIDLSFKAISEVQLYSVSVAAIIAKTLGVSDEKIKKAVSEIKSFSGRMQKLQGIKNSIILDDTYNASPDAVKMALDTLYTYKTNQRIAILGMMNELGESSEEEHKKIGEYCNPKLLDWVVTIGKDANKFLAESAKKKGCQVYTAKNSTEAGNFVKEKIRDGAIVLAKGSQNGVFVEEALKPLLKDKSDFNKLVRQDSGWMNKKLSSLAVDF